MKSNQTSPQNKIEIRRMRFELSPELPRYWADDNPVLTALMSAMSASFPAGERFFIDSVRHYVKQVTSPELRERIRGFIGQEAQHTKEHLAFNQFLEDRGFPVKKIEKQVEDALAELVARSTPEQSLAKTVALEHLTAFLASALLENPEVLERMPEDIAAFWAWHAIEEVEHRSVAFDVYKAHVDDEALRVRTMAIVTLFFSLTNTYRTLLILKESGELSNLRAWAGAFDTLFGREGILRKGMPLYRAYYRRDFHPDEHDNWRELEHVKAKYVEARVA